MVYKGELEALVPARRRTFRTLRLFLTGCLRAWSLVRARNHLLIKLAFEKWHMDREADLDVGAATLHAVRVKELRDALKELPEPLV